jgi:hypothetical protein
MYQPPAVHHLTIGVSHSQACVCLKFSDDATLYLTKEELTAPINYQRACFDLSTVVCIQSWRIVLSKCMGTDNADWRRVQCGQYHAPCHVYILDTAKLFRVLAKLHAKQISATLDARKFKNAPEEIPALSITQIIRHPNASPHRGETYGMAKTLAHFHRILEIEQWTRLLAEMRRMLPLAKFRGCGTEFYFDGRFPGGFGFNGGIIPHGNEFGIHT